MWAWKNYQDAGLNSLLSKARKHLICVTSGSRPWVIARSPLLGDGRGCLVVLHNVINEAPNMQHKLFRLVTNQILDQAPSYRSTYMTLAQEIYRCPESYNIAFPFHQPLGTPLMEILEYQVRVQHQAAAPRWLETGLRLWDAFV